MIEQKQRKILKIDKHLPQIIVPPKTRAMFINWWNSDIRFEKSIPHSFESGYVILPYNYLDRQDELLDTKKDQVKAIAHEYHYTYREAENVFKNILYCFSKLTLYFQFVANNEVKVEIYDNSNRMMSSMEFAVGDSEPEKEIYSDELLFIKNKLNNIGMEFDNDNSYLKYSTSCLLCILVTAFWYIATTKSTKYIYENNTPVIINRKKNIVNVSDTKTIKTPIYDMGKIKIVKVEHLQKRKAGWTYSHSFQVHGHYRHYKSGKVIFVKSFIKGKNKEFKSQQIILDPAQT